MIAAFGYLIYELAINAYFLLVPLAALFSRKAKLFYEGRKGLLTKIERSVSADHRKKIWFHCASLGEFEQARPVLEALKQKDPAVSVIVTFFSPSGYEIRKNYPGADFIFYLPNDSRRNAKRFLAAVNPAMVFFTKYDYWYHYLSQVKEKKIPAYLISASFRKDQPFFKWYGAFHRGMLRCFTHIFTQDQSSLNLLAGIDIINTTLAGDTRFDRVWETRSNHKALPGIADFKKDSPLLVAGSSYEPEEKLIAACLRLEKKLKVIIAPHHIGEKRLRQIEETFAGIATVRYSRYKEAPREADLLIIDNIGMLSSIYAYASIAVVGGGFGQSGLHNILEPATFGIPVLYGPNHHEKFPEAARLVNAGGGFCVRNEAEFLGIMSRFLINEKELSVSGKSALEFIRSNTGATQTILGSIQ